MAALTEEPALQQVHFACRQCSYVVQEKPKGFSGAPCLWRCGSRTVRHLLRDISCEANSGEVLAIMGPSGAGKSTLLRMLSFQTCGGDPHGIVTLNGHEFTPTMYRRYCAAVEQEDTLWTFFTCRDHVSYAVALGMPHLTKQEKQSTVQELLHDLGLESCAFTIAGNNFVPGMPALSGGQRRRLSLAVALAKRPSLIFLDEVTSGLDSTGAAAVMKLLKNLSMKRTLAVICTVHQPSANVFAGFDQTLILADGRVAYSGSASRLAEYMAEIGRPVPSDANPAEFVLRTVNKDFVSRDGVDAVLEHWANHEPRKVQVAATSPLPLAPHRSVCFQFPILFHKHVKLVVRDPLLYSARMVFTVVAVAFYGVTFIHSRERSQDQVLPRIFYGAFSMITVPMLGLVAVVGFYFEGVVVRREMMDAAYSPITYLLTTSVIQLPMAFLISLCGCVTAWVMGDWTWSTMPVGVVILAVCVWSFDCFVQFVSLDHPVLGLLAYQNFWFLTFVFNGLFVVRDEIIWPLRVLYYMSPLMWGTHSFIWSIFKDSPVYEDALVCNPGDTTSAGGVCNDQGFYCPDFSDLQCFGRTGLQQLDSAGDTWRVVDSSETLALDLGMIALIGVVWKIGYVIRLLRRVRNRPHVKKPVPTESSSSGPFSASDVPQMDTKGSPPTAPTTFQFDFRDCSFAVQTKANGQPLWSHHLAPCLRTTEKFLLKDISATVRSGEVLAIMGPSGSGKTTLLNMLSFEHIAGKGSGRVSLNGKILTPATYIEHCAMVKQLDALSPYLTVRENILYALDLCQPSRNSKDTDYLLDHLGLRSCQDVRVGNHIVKGISGGQKRRLSIALALAKKPLLIFLDEPTTGLDAAGASAVMSLLREVARANNAAILCTIHQPSADTFLHFDKTLVLSAGRVAFLGEPAAMENYLDALGKPVPNNTNIADWMLDVVDKDFSDAQEVEKVISAYAESSKDLPATQASPIKLPVHKVPNVFRQICVLLRRQGTLMVRDPVTYVLRAVLCFIMGTFFSLIYLESRTQTQDQVFRRQFMNWWLSNVAAMFGTLPLLTQMLDMPILRREMKDGSYRPVSFILAQGLLEIPIIFLISIAACAPAFVIGDWPIAAFGRYLVSFASGIFAFDALAQLLSMDQPVVGLVLFMGVWFTALLFMGFMIPTEEIIWPLRTFHYILPLRWQVESLSYTLFTSGTDWDGAVLCSTCDSGFQCPGNAGVGCFGVTGQHIMESFSVNYSVFASEDRFGMCLGLVFVFYLVMKVLYFLRLSHLIKGGSLHLLESTSDAKIEGC
uniref:ABC transporter domain-containing protein n=1 Tax=Noctiluca scintillans TaxID=2966 RepID=A0A7S0ZUN7_NOCSC|mmetsp:Transcript_19676/g.52523  ORF Transcript_19676/g.52523 Transcript_19676/m.52523 type:complete len:1289 (+) Transcript_19676:67-3933(+)